MHETVYGRGYATFLMRRDADRARADRVHPARSAGRDPPADHPQPRPRGQAVPGGAVLRDGAGRAADRDRRAGSRCGPTPGAAPTISATRATTSTMAGRSWRPRCGSSTRSMSAQRFLGGPERDLSLPYFVEHGASDEPARDDGRRIASFIGTVEVPAGRRGARCHRAGSGAGARSGRGDGRAIRFAGDRRAGPGRHQALLGGDPGRICGSRPTSRRSIGWSTTGCPTSCSPRACGAAAARTSAAAPSAFATSCRTCCRCSRPARTWPGTRSCCMPASSSCEGDVLQWWHPAPEGGTGLGARNNASDPHLWLPYLVAALCRADRRPGHPRRAVAVPRGPADPTRSRGHQLRAAAVARGGLALRPLPPGDRLHLEPDRAERAAADRQRRLERRAQPGRRRVAAKASGWASSSTTC